MIPKRSISLGSILDVTLMCHRETDVFKIGFLQEIQHQLNELSTQIGESMQTSWEFIRSIKLNTITRLPQR